MSQKSRKIDSPEAQKKIQEFQILDQNLQNISMQKKTFEMERNETNSALDEIKSSGEDVFKIIGQLFIKTEKEKISKELEEKKKLIELRIKSLERQEKDLIEKIESIREEVVKLVNQ